MEEQILNSLKTYSTEVAAIFQEIRPQLQTLLPQIEEKWDEKKRMLFYSYGKGYKALICVLILSKKGVKLGFNRGVLLKNPYGLLQGDGKISRYMDFKSTKEINKEVIKETIEEALELYKRLILKA